MNRAASPIALGAQVAPGLDVLVAELACLRIDRVELREAQTVDRVVLVDEDPARCGLSERADAAGRDADRRRLVAVLVDEGLLFRRKHFPSDRSQVALAGNEARSARAGSAQVHRETETWILLAVDLHPAKRDLVHDVGADEVELLFRLALDFTRLPARNGRVDLEVVLRLGVFQRGCGHCAYDGKCHQADCDGDAGFHVSSVMEKSNDRFDRRITLTLTATAFALARS